jgi:hypothetical protein
MMHRFLIQLDYRDPMFSLAAFNHTLTGSHRRTGHPTRMHLPLTYAATWVTIAAAVPVAAIILALSGMQFRMTGILLLSASLTMLCVAHFFYQFVRPRSHLALATGIFSMIFLASILAAIICHAGLRLGTPWIDGLLDAADRAMGIRTPQLALWLALDSGLGPIFDIAYRSTPAATFLTAIWLCSRLDTDRLWEMSFCYSACIILASISNAAFPAVGSSIYHHIDGTPGLPAGAGNFYMDAIRYFRDPGNTIFDWTKINGIVTFPSFHMVMAIIIPYACRDNRILFRLTATWGILVAISAICIGGHYVVDLLGGAAIWGACALLVRKMTGVGTRHQCNRPESLYSSV